MPKRKPDRAKAIYDLYQQGHSVAQIATTFGVSYQAAYAMLKRYGLTVKPQPKPLPFVLFNEQKYTRKKSGYYVSTSRTHSLLHRDIWQHYNGEIPDGAEVHHKDENPANNCIENLELRTSPDHASHHMKKRRAAGFVPGSQWQPGESPIGNREIRSNTANAKRKRAARQR